MAAMTDTVGSEAPRADGSRRCIITDSWLLASLHVSGGARRCTALAGDVHGRPGLAACTYLASDVRLQSASTGTESTTTMFRLAEHRSKRAGRALGEPRPCVFVLSLYPFTTAWLDESIIEHGYDDTRPLSSTASTCWRAGTIAVLQ